MVTLKELRQDFQAWCKWKNIPSRTTSFLLLFFKYAEYRRLIDFRLKSGGLGWMRIFTYPTAYHLNLYIVCKKNKNGGGYWRRIETNARFQHYDSCERNGYELYGQPTSHDRMGKWRSPYYREQRMDCSRSKSTRPHNYRGRCHNRCKCSSRKRRAEP